MSRNGQNPKSYEDIVRKTVVDPDSSTRPTVDQQRDAHQGGYRALDADEQVLHDRVSGALSSAGVDVADVSVEVRRELVTLRGRVRDAAALRALEDAVARVSGVDTVHNQVVIG